MTGANQLEKANFRSLIENDGIGKVRDRLNIIDTFFDTEEHVTLKELIALLKARGYDYDSDFVRQCMRRWHDYGFAQEIQFEGQPVRYEHRHLGRHHDHLICTRCGKITEFSEDEIESLQAKIAAEQNFYMLQHKMEIYGLCSQCVADRLPLMPLTMANPGEKLIIKDIKGGRTALKRLISMGFHQGEAIEVINNDGHGRLIVGRDYVRLALGRGLAQKIMVTLAPQGRGKTDRSP